MRKEILNLVLLSLLLLQSFLISGQIFTENFAGGTTLPPSGWTFVGGGEENWQYFSFTNNAGGTAPEIAFSWGPPYFDGNSKMVSPQIATSGYSSLLLEFHSYVWDFAGTGYSYKIETTSDNGETWNEVWSISPTEDVPADLVSIVIDNSDVGSDQFQFAITFDGSTTNINYWYVDDFVLSNNTAETYAVTFVVKDEDNNPVEGASVNLQSAGTLLTDAAGEVVFANILPGAFDWWATGENFSVKSGMVNVTDSDTQVDVTLGVSYELLAEYFAPASFPPVGWSILGDGGSNWSRVLTNFAGESYPETRFEASPVFNGTSRLVSPPVNTNNYEDLFLEFNHNLFDAIGSGYSIKVETTSDSGITWNELWSVSPTGNLGVLSETLLISNDDVGSDVFQFAFTFDGNSANVTNWYLDDVILTGALQYDAAIISANIPSLATLDLDVEPSVEVGNLGADTTSFDVTIEFTNGTDVYNETLNVADLAPLATETVFFPLWTPSAGSFVGEAYVTLGTDENIENDLVNFGIEVASELVDKKPLYEMFTSSTCPPCPIANAALDGILEVNPDEYTVIKYQMNFPGLGDQYYTDEGGERSDYYDLASIPDLYVNSASFSPAASITQADFDEFGEFQTALIVDITEATINVENNMVSVSADLTSLINYSAGLKAHIVVVEKLTTGNVGSNGEEEFHYVMMKMLPDASGQSLSALETGVTTSISGEYDMSLTNMETLDDLAVIVFVEDINEKNVLQSEMMDVSVITNLEETLYSKEKIILTPNPTSHSFILDSRLDFQKIEIYNQLGELIKSNNHHGNKVEMNIQELTSGIYFVKVYVQGKIITKSLVVK